MKMNLRSLCLTSSLVASFAFAASAHAITAPGVVYGSVWENATSYPSTFPATTPSGTPTATFDLAAANGQNFNFVSGNSNDLTADPTYTLGGYLTSGTPADTLAFTSGASHSGDTINNDVFQFTGTTLLQAGTTYNITHDDGMYLFLTGNGLNNFEEINSGSPTAAEGSTFSVNTTGIYSFNLLYAEVNGAPAVLSGNLGAIQPVPEPSSFVMLGSGLLAAAGMVRRRFAA